MAREIENYRQVTNVTPDMGIAGALKGAGEMGAGIIKASQEAKIVENFSVAQIELSKAQMQYKTEFADNPKAGWDAYKTKEKEIYDSLGEGISPFFQKPWQDSTRDYSRKTNAEMEMWVYKQSRANTVKSINKSIANNMGQANLDGQAWGQSDQAELGGALNFMASKEKLVKFADGNGLGDQATPLFESYDGDYLKSFVSGVSDTNPVKALQLMDDPRVKSGFKDASQYVKMRDAVEKRALNVGKVMEERAVLGVLRDENNVLTQSLQQPMSYAQLQQAFDTQKTSPAAQSFFLKLNGFAERGGKLSASEQMTEKADIYESMAALSSPDREMITGAELKGFQERIYKGMDNGTLSQEEGLTYLNQVMSPYLEKAEEKLSNFGEKKWFTDSLGFQGVKEVFEDTVAVEVPDNDGSNADERKAVQAAEALNNANKVKMYDYYFDALTQQAASYGKSVADIQSMNETQKRKIYSDALAQSQRMFMTDTNPALATLPDMPNQVFKNGTLIQGAAGARALKPDLNVAPKFKTFKGSDGVIYRQYPNGKYEAAGKWK
jgi:hypothetical protein